MKGKLIKVDKGYYNLEDEKGNILGTSYQFNSSVGDVLEYKLSKQNCDEIFLELYDTEIEVEIEMFTPAATYGHSGWHEEPKLDENGCLILRKI
jgi:hypothetical protein